MRAAGCLLLGLVLVAAHAAAGDAEIQTAIRNFNPATVAAKKDRYKYIVSLNYNNKNNPNRPASLNKGDYFCTGTLIAPNMVLTAASCIYANDLVMVSGRVFPQARVSAYNQPAGKGKSYDALVLAMVYHSFYNFGDTFPSFDLAIMRLDKNITAVKPVKLPPVKTIPSYKNGTFMAVLGWGPSNGTQTNTSSFLRWTDIRYMPLKDCQKEWPGKFWDTGRLVCARFFGHGKNTCYNLGKPGDGGAPLIIEDPKGDYTKDVQVGLVNRGRCNRHKPTIFQSTEHMRTWIDNGVKILNGEKELTGLDPYFLWVKAQWPSFND